MKLMPASVDMKMRAVILAIYAFSNARFQNVWPTSKFEAKIAQSQLETFLGCKRTTIKRRLDELFAAGLVNWTDLHTEMNTYTVYASPQNWALVEDKKAPSGDVPPVETSTGEKVGSGSNPTPTPEPEEDEDFANVKPLNADSTEATSFVSTESVMGSSGVGEMKTEEDIWPEFKREISDEEQAYLSGTTADVPNLEPLMSQPVGHHDVPILAHDVSASGTYLIGSDMNTTEKEKNLRKATSEAKHPEEASSTAFSDRIFVSEAKAASKTKTTEIPDKAKEAAKKALLAEWKKPPVKKEAQPAAKKYYCQCANNNPFCSTCSDHQKDECDRGKYPKPAGLPALSQSERSQLEAEARLWNQMREQDDEDWEHDVEDWEHDVSDDM